MKYISLICICCFFFSTTRATPSDSLRDGQHDFDFNIGNWITHIKRLRNPFTDSASWTELNGTVKVRKVWNGRAQLEEIEADGAIGHFEGATLFLYNPNSHQWSQNFASSSDPDIENPTIGSFKDGIGELYSQDMNNGRAVVVRGIWSNITADGHRYEESLSEDGGKTWQPVFTANLTRDNSSPAVSVPVKTDFDFAFGTWKEHTSRLSHPLTGSTTWSEMNGTSVVSKIWNGRGSITELESDGPSGHLELLALRLYNPETHQWYLTFATSKVGILGMPACIGSFKNGRGDFYDQEMFNGKAIWVRFTIIYISGDSFRSEQAFSADGGKTWETNWINTYSRLM